MAIKPTFKNWNTVCFFFTHKVDNCFSTMAIEAGDFVDLYSGNIYQEHKTLSEECPQYCID